MNSAFGCVLPVLLLLLLAASGETRKWDDFRVRFGQNPQTNFIQMPRTVADALSKGFRQETSCDAAKNGFVGRRFTHTNGDRSVMLLFDTNGIIAGIQTQVPKSTGYPTPEQKQFHDMWVEEPTVHVLSAYFVEPSSICTRGRTEWQLENEGTGSGIFLQKGRAKSNTDISVMTVETNENRIGDTLWTKGKCVVFMGMHYWYNFRTDMNCNDYNPYFLLFNNKKVDAFGFAIPANYHGEFYEHPTLAIADTFFPMVPTCMYDPSFTRVFSSMHVYFYKEPWTTYC